jgi:hypothetical protein
MMQVRGLINGQDWFDLRQYRLDPPYGANVHWSRLVDLPIAGITLALRLFMSGAMAEKIAVAAAPLLPMLVTMGAIGALTRRRIGATAVAVALGLLLCAHSVRGMWAPLRIDHHGWQLAMLSLAMLALTDRRPARGGAMLGLATALSLSIGLEMLLYLAAAGGAVALMWVRDQREAPRLAAYGVQRQSPAGLRRLVAGVAVDARGGGSCGRAPDAVEDGKLGEAAAVRRGGGGGRGGDLRDQLAALPGPARRQHSGAGGDVAEPRPGGAAHLHA